MNVASSSIGILQSHVTGELVFSTVHSVLLWLKRTSLIIVCVFLWGGGAA